MLNIFHQAKRVCGKLILALALMLVACAPTSPLPNQINSSDSIGEMVIRYPGNWRNFAEQSPIISRLFVTLIRADQSAIESANDIATLPVLRVSYSRRAETLLAESVPLAEYALRTASEQWPNVTFEPPQLRQFGSRAAVNLQGIDASTNLVYRYTIIDFISEQGVVFAVLTAPEAVSPYTSAVDLMLENVRLTITPASEPQSATLPPESTADLPSSTSDAISGDAATPAPESSAEVTPPLLRPESTAELPPLSQENGNIGVEPTLVIERGAENSATAVTTADPTNVALPAEVTAETETEVITIARGVQFQRPSGWIMGTNSQTNVTLADGWGRPEAMLLAKVLPKGEALISIEIGTLEEVFRQPLNGFSLQRWLTNELGTLVTEGGAAAQATEIEELAFEGEVIGIGALVTTPRYDHYVIAGELGGSLYKRVQLYTAPGEFIDYQPILLQVAASIELAPR